MRLSLLYIFFLVVCTVLSCKKNKNGVQVDTKTLEVTLMPNEDYEYDLGGFSDEEGAGIEKQASNFVISDMKRKDSKNRTEVFIIST
jgi:hypothetical protein